MGKPVRDVLADVADQMENMAEAIRGLADASGGAPPIEAASLEHIADRILNQRKARTRFLPPSLFHEPAWEILLHLYLAQRQGRTVNIKHLTQAVEAPVTTAQRWVDALAHMKLIHRVTDTMDRRRTELTLTDTAIQAVENYLSWLASPGPEQRRAAG